MSAPRRVPDRRVPAPVVAVLVPALLTLTACGSHLDETADSYARSSARTISDWLRTEVVTPGQPAATQLAAVRRFLADPSPEFTRANTYPTLSVLAADATKVETVVYASTRGQVFEGSGTGRGRVCVRYTVDRAEQLQAADIDCPAGTPRTPVK